MRKPPLGVIYWSMASVNFWLPGMALPMPTTCTGRLVRTANSKPLMADMAPPRL